jgi:hypothetical protein
MKRLTGVLLGVGIAVLVGLGCSPTADVGNGNDPIDRDTPDHLLNWLSYYYQERDIDRYEEALHEAFIFVFTKDVADSLGLPDDEPWWGRTQDVNSTRKMFAASEVTDIKMDYVNVERWQAVTDSVGGQEYHGVFSRVTPEIFVTIDRPNEEPTTHVVRESWLDITVVEDPTVQEEVLFVLLKIEEVEMPSPD